MARRDDGFSQYFHTHHRGKRSIAVDLRSSEGRDLVYELVKRVDVVTENFKPGVMDRLGLGWEDLKQRNPRLVYASASGFGPKGPRANATSWASVAGAAGGGMWPNGVRGEVNGNGGAKPYANVAAPDPDQTGGMIFAFAIASALVARERTGEGQLVQTSLYGSQIWGRAPAINAIANGNVVPSARNMPISNMFTLQAQGSDGDWLFVGYITDRWVPMCRALEREDLVIDARFATLPDRNANLEELRSEVASVIATRSAAEWPSRFDAEEVPSTLIQDYPMIASDEQAAANEYIVQYEDERFGALTTVGSPIRANGVQGRVQCLGPELGQDTDALLEEIGCAPEAIAQLREAGIVG